MKYTIQAKEGDIWCTLDSTIEASSRKDAVRVAEKYSDALCAPVRIIKAGNNNGIIVERI